MKLFSTSPAQPVASLPADPRARRALSSLLEGKSMDWRARRCASADLPCQYCWLYWLLRSRQPRLALTVGQVQADWLIVAGCAVSAQAGGRLLCQADEQRMPPRQGAGNDLQEGVTRAGLDWGIRLLEPEVEHQPRSIDALILASKLDDWHERLIRLAPILAPGAFVIGLVSKATRDSVADTIEGLKSASPDFKAMLMDISDSALILADFRGA